MVPSSLDSPELQLLIGLLGVLIFIALFLALFSCAILGLGLARLFYVGGRWCVRKIHQSYSLGGTRTMNAIGRIVLHH
jgi:hypothetical protein